MTTGIMHYPDPGRVGHFTDCPAGCISGHGALALPGQAGVDEEITEGVIVEDRVLTDEQALDQIQEMLRDPEWGVGMLEDIRELVEQTGRSCEDYPDGRATWGRH